MASHRSSVTGAHPLLVLLAVTSLLKQVVRSQYRDYFLATTSIALIYLSGPFLLWFGGMTPGSHRFFMVPVAVALPWAAVTIEMMAARMEASDVPATCGPALSFCLHSGDCQ